MIVLICNAETKTHSFFKAQIRYFCVKVNWELLNHSVYSKKGLKFQPPPPLSDLSSFCFLDYPLDLLMASMTFWTHFPTSSRGGSSTNCTRQALYLLLALHLKWRNVAFPAILRVRLSQCVKSSPQILLNWQLRRKESPSDLAGRKLQASVRCYSISS